ncbi:hypothetical protein EJ06DRAFT_468703 [Trichodelitschia bisporula]|uniref:C2 domain-containing protein n=1 Tax=Trichodelitschia bisporula TaxID=703511 RepID=A0A6G1IBF3_9PEZI|nr:hypothetical protein EJ06DRAFT_468703 [Trichodelitschia bisporula]
MASQAIPSSGEFGPAHEQQQQQSNGQQDTSKQSPDGVPKAPHISSEHADGAPGAHHDAHDEEHHKKEHDDKSEGKSEHKDEDEHKQPDGGYDSTPLPSAPAGYTVKITFNRASNLPMADINSFSSDPYIIAQMYHGLPTRHKEDPPLQFRTPTVRRNTDPVWDCDWIVAHVPVSGFRLKCRIYDEDPADHDDRLGNAHVIVGGLDSEGAGFHEQNFKIKKRMGSKRAYMIRGVAALMHTAKHMDGHLFVSVEVLGPSEGPGGRVYTIGPIWWTKHHSPLLGRLANRKTEDGEEEGKDKTERFNFQAVQLQLPGPVPEEMYHRFVEFRPFVKRMFTASGLSGFFLSKALHHQHARVYNFDRTTEYGIFPSLTPAPETTTLKFLELVNFDKGGRVFTYVLTLDALFRFTETGKEFGIDMLSKHTMHSDVAAYIAFSGEFFVRRWPKKASPSSEGSPTMEQSQASSSHHEDTDEDDAARDPSLYQLVIDNDSGTYRPNADLLPQLKSFMQYCFPGLHVMTLDCQKDAEKQQRMKAQQRERKARTGNTMVFRQMSDVDSSSISSSDESELDEMIQAQLRDQERQAHVDPGFMRTMKRDAAAVGGARMGRWKEMVKGRDGEGAVEVGNPTDGQPRIFKGGVVKQ